MELCWWVLPIIISCCYWKVVMEPCSNALFSYLLDDLYGLRLDRSDWDKFITSPAGSGIDFWPGATPLEIGKLRLVRSFYKKLVDQTAADADQRCLEKFLASNNRCLGWELDCNHAGEGELIGLVKQEIDDFFHPGGKPLISSLFQILSEGKTGPGASLGANGVDFYTKLFSSRLTATSQDVYDMYADYASWFPDWLDAELTRFIKFGGPRIIRGSKLSFVRKTRDISRSICTEPSLNMFMQLGFGNILSERLRESFGINLARQPDKNRELAKLGSINGSIVTIDLEGASDSLSLSACEELLPKWVFEILLLLRSSKTTLPDGSSVPLYMVSSMGNGFTFPLQTIIFSCVVRAAYRSLGQFPGRADCGDTSWGVFGDDIIADTNVSARICRCLELLGFVVNGSKSYFVGPFRESCGFDYYEGVNVRGVYLKTLLTPQSRYVAINLLMEWSARLGVPLPRTVGYLCDTVRELAIPPHASIDSGIRVPESVIRGSGYYHSKKQRYLYRCYEPMIPFLRLADDGSGLPGVNPKQVRARKSNPSGLLFSVLGGYVSCRGSSPNYVQGVALALKQGERPFYSMRLRVSPFWGPSIVQISSQGSVFWERWNSAVHEVFIPSES